MEVPARSFLVTGKTSVIFTILIGAGHGSMTVFFIIHRGRNNGLQIVGDKQVPSIPVTAPEL